MSERVLPVGLSIDVPNGTTTFGYLGPYPKGMRITGLHIIFSESTGLTGQMDFSVAAFPARPRATMSDAVFSSGTHFILGSASVPSVVVPVPGNAVLWFRAPIRLTISDFFTGLAVRFFQSFSVGTVGGSVWLDVG
jgi:hypothetical protein